MKLTLTLERKNDLNGKFVSVEGYIVVTIHGAYLAPSVNDSDDKRHSISIDRANIDELLDDKDVPCYVGTEVSHAGWGEVTGTLNAARKGKFEAVLENPEKLTILVDDEKYTINL